MVKTEDTPAPVKKRSPNRLLVDEATNDDNSVRAAASDFAQSAVGSGVHGNVPRR